MSSTLTLILVSIVLLSLLLLLLYFFRRRVELSLEKDILILEYPFTTRRIDLEKELKNWEIQKANYIRWGVFYSINMLFKNGKRVVISSLLNQNGYNLLYDHLNSRFRDRRKP